MKRTALPTVDEGAARRTRPSAPPDRRAEHAAGARAPVPDDLRAVPARRGCRGACADPRGRPGDQPRLEVGLLFLGRNDGGRLYGPAQRLVRRCAAGSDRPRERDRGACRARARAGARQPGACLGPRCRRGPHGAARSRDRRRAGGLRANPRLAGAGAHDDRDGCRSGAIDCPSRVGLGAAGQAGEPVRGVLI